MVVRGVVYVKSCKYNGLKEATPLIGLFLGIILKQHEFMRS